MQQFDHPAIRHLSLHSADQRRMRNRVEIAFQVRVDHPVVSCPQQGVDPAQRVLAAPMRSEPVALRREVPLENRLQHCPERRLYHPVTHRRNPQGALFLAPHFEDPVTPNRWRAIASLPQPSGQLFQVRFQVMLELGHRHTIHACGSVVGLHASEGLPQSRQGADLVHQAVPLASLHSLFESRQHPFRPNPGFDPGPSSPNLSGGCSPLSGHSVRGCLPRFVRHVSTFLRSLRSMAVTPLLRYYGRCDSVVHSLCSALPRRRGRLFCTPVSLIHAIGLPAILSPITCGRSVSPRHVTCRWIGPRRHPSAGYVPGGSITRRGMPSWRAGAERAGTHTRRRAQPCDSHL